MARGTTLKIEGGEHFAWILDKMLADTEDLHDAWPLYHAAFKNAEAEYFASSGEGKWRPLTARYAKWKAAHGGGDGVLRLTGNLLGSLAGENGDHIFEPSARYMRTGSKARIANIHFSKKRKKRRPMDVNSTVMQTHMREAVEKHADRYAETWGSALR